MALFSSFFFVSLDDFRTYVNKMAKNNKQFPSCCGEVLLIEGFFTCSTCGLVLERGGFCTGIQQSYEYGPPAYKRSARMRRLLQEINGFGQLPMTHELWTWFSKLACHSSNFHNGT